MSAFHDELRQRFGAVIPHCAETGILITALDKQAAVGELPYRPEWLADPERGMLHPGIVTTLVDSTCGVALIGHLESYEPIATVDLRVDYLRPAFAGSSVLCRAECYRVTRYIAFVRAVVQLSSPSRPVDPQA